MNQASEHDLQLAKWLGGAALGALAMYMLDPDRGAPRRAVSGARLRDLGRQTGGAVDKVMHSISQRASGIASAGSDLAGSAAQDGGAGQRSDGAQGQAVSSAPSASTLSPQSHAEEAWAPAIRNAALVGGGTLSLASMMSRRIPLALMLGLAGVALLTRGATNRSLRRMVGLKGTGAAFDIEKSVHVNAAPEHVYDLWTNYENFPRFMANVIEVRDLGDRRSHWVVKGPAGSEVEFDAILTEQSRPHRLAWQSVPGSEVEQTGSVRFEPVGGGTRAIVSMHYQPPAGAVGQAVATLFGCAPETELEEDLNRLKSLVEGGAPLRTEGRAGADSKVLH